MHNVGWLKHMHFQPNDITCVLELKDAEDIGNDVEPHAGNATSEMSVTPLKLGGSIMWSDLLWYQL